MVVASQRSLHPPLVRFTEICGALNSQQRGQPLSVDQRVSLWRTFYFIVSTKRPLRRVLNDSGPNHVQIDIDHALNQMRTLLYCRRGMVPILPKRALSILSLIVLLRGPSCHQLHGLGQHLPFVVILYKDSRLWLCCQKLNHRSRKCLGYQSPHEVFWRTSSGALAT